MKVRPQGNIQQRPLWGGHEDNGYLYCVHHQPLQVWGTGDQRENHCSYCKNKQYAHMRIRRDAWLKNEDERNRLKEQNRQKMRLSLKIAIDQSWRERDRWYAQRSTHRCCTCRQALPTSAFGGECDASGFHPHPRCLNCRSALHERKLTECCLCMRKTERQEFISLWDGYSLRGSGTCISLCCHQCERAFLGLPALQQRAFIKECCQRSFPSSQVIYGETDPETQEIRYIGRTSHAAVRHRGHLHNISPYPALWGSEQKVWYTRRNWMDSLMSRGLEPSMQILRKVEVSMLVVEWEHRLIWHGIQQGWNLLNVETADEAAAAQVKSTPLDFLTASFATLVEHGFFAAYGIEAFLRMYGQ